jgi:hypothetical protein
MYYEKISNKERGVYSGFPSMKTTITAINIAHFQTIIQTQTQVLSAKCVHLTIYFPYPTVDHVCGYTQ